MRRAVVVIGLLLSLAGCSWSGDSTTPNSAAEAGAADATSVLGGQWKSLRQPRFADEFIVDRCGNPATGLGAPDADLIASDISPSFQRDAGEGGDRYGDARTAVLVYETRASAQAAYDQLRSSAYEDCLVGAVNAYLGADPGADTVPRATADSFDTTHAPVVSGDEATLIEGAFPEEVLGGNDNEHTTALFVGRSGPVVVTALAASNAQNPDPGNSSSLARRLGVSALARATAG